MNNIKRRASIKRRLLLSTTLILAVMLFAGGWALTHLFESHVERRVEKELHVHLNRLISTAHFLKDGSVTSKLTDMAVRFQTPYSGLYWQISERGGKTLTSASLWDAKLELPEERINDREVLEYKVRGPAGRPLIVVRRQLTRQIAGKIHFYEFAVGLDHTEVSSARKEFSKELAIGMTGLAVALILLLGAQITFGLAPLRHLIPAVNAISSGKAKRFSDDYPVEIAPLVEKLNSLLEQQEIVMERSRARAASLAHGLKTPIAGISLEIQKLHQTDNEAARNIDEMVARMNRQVERELIRTRIRGTTHGIKRKNLVAPLARDIIRTLMRQPRGEEITWTMSIAEDMAVIMDTDDLAEILGNLLDNARKWAHSKVHIEVRQHDQMVTMIICDDGRGLRPEQLGQIQDRGLRFDDHNEGSGLGVAIVHDIVTGYGGEFQAFQSELGGLGIRLILPSS